MNGIIYYTKIRDEYNSKNMEHMIGEKLLEIGLEREFGRKLAFEIVKRPFRVVQIDCKSSGSSIDLIMFCFN